MNTVITTEDAINSGHIIDHRPSEIEATYLNQILDVDGNDAVILGVEPIRNGSGREIGTAYTVTTNAWEFVQETIHRAGQYAADQMAEAEDGQLDDTDTGRIAERCGCGAWDDLQGDHRRAGCPAEHLPIGATVHYLGLTQTVVARTGIYQTGGKAAAGHSDMVILVLDNGRGWPKPVEVEAERLLRRA